MRVVLRKTFVAITVAVCALLAGSIVLADTTPAQTNTEAPKPVKKQWFDTIKMGGYVQGRWQYYPDAEDSESNEFLLRRARIKISANPTDDTYAEVEVDLGESKVEARSIFLDWTFVNNNDARAWVRIGQSKVPFGFETPQSSSVRLPLERNWLARWTFPGERDTGIVGFYTRNADKELFEAAKKSNYGTGDYGNFALGIYNGQGANKSEENSKKTIVARVAKPFMLNLFDNETYAELGASYWNGDYTQTGTTDTTYDDEMLGLHAYLAPNPFGFQAEYYTGEAASEDADGWYAMGIWRASENVTAFARYDTYEGGRKGKLGSIYELDRFGLGLAYELNAKSRITVQYDMESQDSPKEVDNDLFGIQYMIAY